MSGGTGCPGSIGPEVGAAEVGGGWRGLFGKRGGEMSAAGGQAGALASSGPAMARGPQGLHLRQGIRGSTARLRAPAHSPQQHPSCACQQDRSRLLLSLSLGPQLPLHPSWEIMLHWLQLYHTALGTAEGERASPASFLLFQRSKPPEGQATDADAVRRENVLVSHRSYNSSMSISDMRFAF